MPVVRLGLFLSLHCRFAQLGLVLWAVSVAVLGVQLALSQLGLCLLVTFLGYTPVQLGLVLVAVLLAALGVRLVLSQLGPTLFQALGI